MKYYLGIDGGGTRTTAAVSDESGKILVIGDLEHDAQLAEALGADCVLLTSGHENPQKLKVANATFNYFADMRLLLLLRKQLG